MTTITPCSMCPPVDGVTPAAVAHVPLVTKRWSADGQDLVPAGVDWFDLCDEHLAIARAAGDVSLNAPVEYLL